MSSSRFSCYLLGQVDHLEWFMRAVIFRQLHTLPDQFLG